MPKNLFKIAKEKKIKYFLISFVDLFGVLRSKLVPTRAIKEMQEAGAGFAANPANPAPASCISLMARVGTNFDLNTPNRYTKLIRKYFIFFSLAILNKFFGIN